MLTINVVILLNQFQSMTNISLNIYKSKRGRFILAACLKISELLLAYFLSGLPAVLIRDRIIPRGSRSSNVTCITQCQYCRFS